MQCLAIASPVSSLCWSSRPMSDAMLRDTRCELLGRRMECSIKRVGADDGQINNRFCNA